MNNPRVLTLAAAVLVAALVGGYSIGKTQSPPPDRRPGIGATLDKISAAEPTWHFYLGGQSGIDAGFFVTTEMRAEPDLRALPRSGDALDKWPGVVFVTQGTGGRSSASGYETRVPGFTLFGDPELAAKIAEILNR